MMTPLNKEVAIALALPLFAVAAQIAHSLRARLRTRHKAHCVGRIARMVVGVEDGEMLQRRYLHSTIAESVRFVSEYIYGGAHDRLREVAEGCGVEYTPRCGGHLQSVVDEVAERPERAIRHIARCEVRLSWYDTALLFQLMRRAGAPIAYTPLLLSENRNLQLLGIYLCAHFSVVDAEEMLQRLVVAEDEEVARAALLTICLLRGDISTPQVAHALSRLAANHRATLLRHIVQACYSPKACSALLTVEEQQRLAEQINSYKCRIVCN